MPIDRRKVLARSMAIGRANAKAKKKLDYSRTANSPYPAGSAEDRKLSNDAAAYSAKNRAALGQNVRDVITGRAAAEGAKVVGRGALSLARKGFEAIDKRVAPNTYKRDKDAYNRIQAKKKKK